MAKCATNLVAVVFAILLNSVFGAKCDINTVPETCRPVLSQTIDGAALASPTTFINRYCGDTCAKPLYNYFKNCDARSNNATKFDVFCSSNATTGGQRCLPQVRAGIVANNSFLLSCAIYIDLDAVAMGKLRCASSCKTALAAAHDTLGCCLYSFYAAILGPRNATKVFSLCSEDPRTPCVGGVSGKIIDFKSTNNAALTAVSTSILLLFFSFAVTITL